MLVDRWTKVWRRRKITLEVEVEVEVENSAEVNIFFAFFNQVPNLFVALS